eukprot:Platyproteum_vivax@DN4483_c0_g1_i1.p1
MPLGHNIALISAVAVTGAVVGAVMWWRRRTVPHRLIFVGDVHGCFDELTRLMSPEGVNYNPKADTVVFVGDLINKGPDSFSVIQYVRNLPGQVLSVKGNHEQKLLEVYKGTAEPKTSAQKADLLAICSELSADDMTWISNLPYYINFKEGKTDVTVVHAGVVPGKALEDHTPQDLMTLRNILPDGTGSHRGTEGTPWYQLWHGPSKIIYGHNARDRLVVRPFSIGLDSGCVYGGDLSAYILPDNQIVSITARKQYAAFGKQNVS